MIRHVHVVVNAQFEDRIRARICPGDSLKRARLFDMNEKLPKSWSGEYSRQRIQRHILPRLRDGSRPPKPPNPKISIQLLRNL